MLILFAGAIAEGLAIVALYHQHADAITGTYVLIGAIFLTVTAIIAPAVAAV